MRDAARLGEWILRDVGKELRVSRITSGATQVQVAAVLGISRSHVSRVENGLLKGIGIPDLTRHAASVGLKPWVRLYPTVTRPMDRAQLTLFGRFRERISPSWQVIVEAPMPLAGDLRAADALVSIPNCRIVVEVITRLADLQAHLRAARRKQRDLGAHRLVFVVAANTTNRRALRDAGPALADAFPLETKAALRAMSAGVDPGSDALIVL